MSQTLTADLVYRRSCRNYLVEILKRNDFSEAVRYFESVRKVWKDQLDLDSGIIMRLGAKAYGSSHDFAKALPIIRTAVEVVSRAGESAELGETYLVLGDTVREMGKLAEAEKAFRDAESLFRRNDEITRAGDALNLLAGILFRKGDLDGALRNLLEAVEIARRDNDKKKLAYLFGNIGRVYTFLGKLEAAAENTRLNIELSAEFSDERELARAYLSLGYIYIQQEKLTEAGEALSEAQPYIRRNRLEREEVIYLTYSGELALKENDLAGAGTFLNAAAEKGRKLAPDSLLAARPIRHLADLAARQGNYRKALSLANQGLKTMLSIDHAAEQGALYRLIGQCQEKLEAASKAREAYGRSLEILEEHKIKTELAETLATMGQSALYEAGKQMMYLCRAEDMYSFCGIGAGVAAMQERIGRIGVVSGVPRLLEEKGSIPGTGATKNARMGQILSQLHLLAGSDLPILITGETGTGKDFLARYFHSLVRPHGPFVAINCAAVPDTLLESELFGYQRGAFTGADSNKRGLFLAANRGVLLLDEIGELPLGLQAKLLNVIESKKLRPLGTAEEVSLDLVIVAATNRDLYEMVKAGQFRLDLYYRLAAIPIELPPLRERKEDIPGLLEYFMRRNGLLKEEEKVPPELVRMFVGFDWPGNIRQLENQVKKMAAMSSLGREASILELSRGFFEGKRDQESNSLFEQVERFEKRLLLEALIAANGNKSEAARLLSIHESTLRAKMKRYGMESMVS